MLRRAFDRLRPYWDFNAFQMASDARSPSLSTRIARNANWIGHSRNREAYGADREPLSYTLRFVTQDEGRTEVRGEGEMMPEGTNFSGFPIRVSLRGYHVEDAILILYKSEPVQISTMKRTLIRYVGACFLWADNENSSNVESLKGEAFGRRIMHEHEDEVDEELENIYGVTVASDLEMQIEPSR